MITPSFLLTATERVLPKLALDFTTASLDPRITFTRALNTATRVNSSGYVETVNADTPRFDYNPVTKQCKGLLIEESRTNIIRESENLSVSPWVAAGANAVLTTTLSPNGITAAYAAKEDLVTGPHRRQESIACSAGANTMSVFVKQDVGVRFATIGFSENGSNWASATFDLSLGVSTQTLVGGTFTSVSATVIPWIDGYWRISVTATVPIGFASGLAFVGLSATSTFASSSRGFDSYAGDDTSQIIYWGVQIELGAFPTSYIPTTTTSLTRNADVATMTGTNFSDWFNTAEGTFASQVAFSSLQSNFSMLYSASNSSDSASYTCTNKAGSGSDVVYSESSNGSPQATLNNTTVTASVSFIATFAYKLDSFAASGKGGTVYKDNIGAVPTLDKLDLGHRNGSLFLCGWLQKFQYWPQRLIDAEVQSFSK